MRSGVGALRSALRSTEPCVIVTAADIRTGNPTSPDEANGGDAGSALVIGDDTAGSVIAELIGAGSATREFLDTWKAPGESGVRHWEERFAETQYAPLVADAWTAACKDAGLAAEDVDLLVVSGAHPRAVKSTTRKLGASVKAVAEDLAATVGQVGAADAGLRLAAALEAAEPGQVVAVVSLADGADVLVFRTTDAIAGRQPSRPIAAQAAGGNAGLPYAKFLSWRGAVTVQPPNRPLPARHSASAAGRSEEWKYGFVGSRDRESGAVHLPPARVSFAGGNVDDMEPLPMADATGTVITFTIDRLAYSPSPPVVFAVVDFDGGGPAPDRAHRHRPRTR